MKKLLLSVLLSVFVGINIYAIPAYNKPVKIHQPDGSYITVVGHGDEYRNYVTTTDGYTIVRGSDQLYHYAVNDGENLVASDIVAHDVENRTAEEMVFLANQKKYIAPATTTSSSIARLAPMASEKLPGYEYTDDTPWLAKPKKAINKQSYRGLVILVNYNDCTFLRGDEESNAIFTSLMNGKDVTSFYDSYYNENQTVTGSVRDYFYDNSYGMFDPQFDVVGPVTINYSQYYAKGNDNSLTLANAVINAVDDQVDFSDYDADGDGVVDMFYIIYAGHASSYSGNDERLLWPHASYLYKKQGGFYYNVTKDGIQLGRFACSTELYGWESNSDCQINGIGTICHEFSHVLGYEDHYDTSDGNHQTPNYWDVMAAGSYNGTYGSSPAGYNAYERLTGGFLAPTLLTTDNIGSTITLPALESEPVAYRLNTESSKKEFFLFENRERIKWDTSLPGKGMLIWRVDSTKTSLWSNNTVNSTDQLCLQLVRANGWNASTSDSGADAFPGTKNVTHISNVTSPANLLSYKGDESPLALKNIAVSDEVVSFDVVDPDETVQVPEGSVFYESFYNCTGNGGNDGVFTTTAGTGDFIPDVDGWTCDKKAYGASECAKFGSSSGTTNANTPTFTLNGAATLTFKACNAGTDSKTVKVSVTTGGATTDPVSFSLNRNEWNECELAITGSGETSITFSAVKRFFLDEVLVMPTEEDGIKGVEAAGSAKDALYNLAGQRVAESYRGIVIRNGRKYMK